MPTNEIHVPANWAEELTADVLRAKQSIIITALSMLPPRTRQIGPWFQLWEALCLRARDDVHVEFNIAAPQKAHPATTANIASARFAQHKGIDVHLIPGPKLLHSKQVIIDHNTVWIGSGNFTAAACAHNFETWCRFHSEQIAQRLESRIVAYRSHAYANSVLTQHMAA